MSLTSWKAAFYPESAKAAAKRGEKAAIEHSIRKWEGLTQENLAAHGMKRDFTLIEDPRRDGFVVATASCSLCQIHYSNNFTVPPCDPSCSLVLVRGVPCYDERPGEDMAPYIAFAGIYSDPNSGGDPQPMLRDLRSALELVQITVHDGGPASDR